MSNSSLKDGSSLIYNRAAREGFIEKTKIIINIIRASKNMALSRVGSGGEFMNIIYVVKAVFAVVMIMFFVIMAVLTAALKYSEQIRHFKQNAASNFGRINGFDKYADIIPGESIGGIRLNSTTDELSQLLSSKYVFKKTLPFEDLDERIDCYRIGNYIELYFHKKNKKLYRIIALESYKGRLLDKIKTGMSVDKVKSLAPSFKYDKEENEMSSPMHKGVYMLSMLWSLIM